MRRGKALVLGLVTACGVGAALCFSGQPAAPRARHALPRSEVNDVSPRVSPPTPAATVAPPPAARDTSAVPVEAALPDAGPPSSSASDAPPLLDDAEQARAAALTLESARRALSTRDRASLRMLSAAVEARADDQLLSFADAEALLLASACVEERGGAVDAARAFLTRVRGASLDDALRRACGLE